MFGRGRNVFLIFFYQNKIHSEFHPLREITSGAADLPLQGGSTFFEMHAQEIRKAS